MSKKVRTITGDVAPEALGRTLIHEHLCVDWGDLLGRPKVQDFDRSEMVDRMVAKMDELYAAGIGAMTECTPIGTGRYLDLYFDQASLIPRTSWFLSRSKSLNRGLSFPVRSSSVISAASPIRSAGRRQC